MLEAHPLPLAAQHSPRVPNIGPPDAPPAIAAAHFALVSPARPIPQALSENRLEGTALVQGNERSAGGLADQQPAGSSVGLGVFKKSTDVRNDVGLLGASQQAALAIV